MAESFTTRLHLPRWSNSAADTFSRNELDTAMGDLEARVPRYGNGTIALRPAADAAHLGTFYTVTDPAGGGILGATYFCDGALWLHLNPVATPFVPDEGEVGDISPSYPGDTAAAGATGELADAGHRHKREPRFRRHLLLLGA